MSIASAKMDHLFDDTYPGSAPQWFCIVQGWQRQGSQDS